jgi:glycosyltransferase involved in cell wall biosynthesis
MNLLRRPFGFDVYGLFGIPSGLGIAAGNTLTALRASGRPVEAWDVTADATVVPESGEPGSLPRLGVNLFHVNPDWIRNMLAQPANPPLRCAGKINVCVPFWELPRVSADWLELLRGMDLVLAPTRFVLDALVDSGLDTRVVHYPQAVFLPDGVAADRARFGIPAGAIAFAMSLAPLSFAERKNPWAAVEAFTRAFGPGDDACLVVRVHVQPGGAERAEALLEPLRDLAARDPRVVLVEGDLAYADVLSLYASCDAYVSLHRAEGLGLGMMEAMSLGRAVVATGWSGNMDFMSGSNSLLVSYTLVPADLPPDTAYGQDVAAGGVMWAEPDADAAARHMRALYEDPALRARLGERAALDMEARRSNVLLARFADEVEHLFDTELSSRQHRERAGILDGLQRPIIRGNRLERAKRAGVRLARAMRLKPPAPRE